MNRGETIQTLAEILLHVDALSASLEKVSQLASKMSPGASRTTLIHLVLAVSAERERQMERARTRLCQGRAEVERECGAEEASKHFALMEARHEAARATYGVARVPRIPHPVCSRVGGLKCDASAPRARAPSMEDRFGPELT